MGLKKHSKILNRYGLGEETSFEEVSGGFNKNYDISVSGGRFFLKQRPSSHARNAVTDCQVAEHLKSQGIDTGKPVKSLDGNYTVKDGMFVYCMFDYKDGELYQYSEDNLRIVGESLALFHKGMHNYEGRTSFDYSAIEWSMEMLEGLDNLSEWKGKINAAERVIGTYRPPKCLIHWDFHGGNMKIVDGKAIPFDFEFAHYDYRILDIANSAICMAAINHDETNYGNAESFIQKCELDFEKNDAFLSGYEKILHLTEEEIKVFSEALEIAWIGWTAYTLKNMECSKQTIENAKHFPNWVEKNRYDISKNIQRRR